jgi:hypothetical protein
LPANAKIAYWPRELRFPGAIAQLEEHLLCKQGVRGSSPLSSTWGFCPMAILKLTPDIHC